MLVHCGPLSPPGVDPLQVGDGVETGSRTGCGGAKREISGANVASKSNLGVSCLLIPPCNAYAQRIHLQP